MVRTVWTGLICLIAICGLTAYKVGFATPANNAARNQDAVTAPATLVADAADGPVRTGVPPMSVAPATKTDRLDVDYLQDVPRQTLVHTIPIVVSDPAIPAASAKAEPEKAPAAEKTSKIVSRHWRASYARYTRRHYRHVRETARPAPEAKPAHTGLFSWLKPAT